MLESQHFSRPSYKQSEATTWGDSALPAPTTQRSHRIGRSREHGCSSATPLPFLSIGSPDLNHNHGHGHGHEGVLDPKSFRDREDERPAGMGSWLSSPVLVGSSEPDSWLTIPNRRDSIRHEQVSPWFLLDVVHVSYSLRSEITVGDY
jgi:hypothetical protein